MLFSAITQKLKCQIPIPDGFLLTLTPRRPPFSSPKCGSGAPRVALCQRGRLPRHEALEMQVSPLGREDPLEEEMAATPAFLPGNPMHRGAWRAAVHGLTRAEHD